MNLIEQIRSLVTSHTLSLTTVAEAWPQRRDLIRARFANPNQPTPQELLELGSYLSVLFQSSGAGDRTNAGVSAGGTVWAALVTWYLNICYAGTDAIAFCAGKDAPSCLKDALSVTYSGSSSLRSDTDIVLLSIPGLSALPSAPSKTAALAQLKTFTETNFERAGMVNIQCKTNWNDNAQIPMLWNLIFTQARNGTNPPQGFLVGQGTHHVSNLGYFAYSFVTVPTSSGGQSGYDAGGMPVQRVASLSGGYYWGHPTTPRVCKSVKEFFNHQYAASQATMPNVRNIGAGYANAASGRQNPNGVVIDAFRISAA